MNINLVHSLDTNGDGHVDCMEFVNQFEQTLPTDMAEFGILIRQFIEVARQCREGRELERMKESRQELSVAETGHVAEMARIRADLAAAEAKQVKQMIDLSLSITLALASCSLLLALLYSLLSCLFAHSHFLFFALSISVSFHPL